MTLPIVIIIVNMRCLKKDRYKENPGKLLWCVFVNGNVLFSAYTI